MKKSVIKPKIMISRSSAMAFWKAQSFSFLKIKVSSFLLKIPETKPPPDPLSDFVEISKYNNFVNKGLDQYFVEI